MSDRLDKLLNMLASPNDGEVANAGRMIAAVAHAANKTVSGLVRTGGGGGYSERIVYRTDPSTAAELVRLREENARLKRATNRAETFEDDDLRSYRRERYSGASGFNRTGRDSSRERREEESDAELRKDLLWALHYHMREGDVLTPWEVEFCQDMTHTFPSAMSYRQRDLAKQIIKKARRNDREPLI